ncbi:hypothetical protein [Nocardia transvalensis]|uniref:hypothetical protein n=1 Tax=Nocardia transvalensis TaxID=37333 RepID=UPI0018957CBF|nr:hypothetical protein [Nocardia transvalensis]MBF6332559.1 hypothetical protein [Nocardia transvalensis]
MRLEEVTQQLYGLDPAEFIAARDEQVKAARAAGDKESATAIGKLRKPTVAAWAVNLLAREAAEEVGALLDLGAALQDAQRRLSGDQLRALTTQRQQVVNALSHKAAQLASERGRELGEPVLREVGQTLHAALADPDVAQQVRDGVLTTAANYEGFGPAGPALSAVPEPTTRREPKSEPKPKPDRAAAARQELDDALEALETAREAKDSAQSDLDRHTQEVAELDSRIAELRAELDRTEDRRRFAAAAERSAQEALHKAERQLDRVQRWVDKARSRLPEQ